MSFALTAPQILARTKTVTRRLGWTFLKAGDQVRAVKQCQGLKKGEKVEPLAVLRIVDVRREPLERLTLDVDYGVAEVVRDGFGHLSVSEFVTFFCKTHRPCEPWWKITRIEFAYDE